MHTILHHLEPKRRRAGAHGERLDSCLPSAVLPNARQTHDILYPFFGYPLKNPLLPKNLSICLTDPTGIVMPNAGASRGHQLPRNTSPNDVLFATHPRAIEKGEDAKKTKNKSSSAGLFDSQRWKRSHANNKSMHMYGRNRLPADALAIFSEAPPVSQRAGTIYLRSRRPASHT